MSLFSDFTAGTQDVHFRWMREYGLDGVFVQRFVNELQDGNSVFKDAVLVHALRARDAQGPERARPVPTARAPAARRSSSADVDLRGLAKTKLGLKGEREFRQPAEILAALDNREIFPTGSFQPPAYAQLRRSVYVHDYERERLEADEVMVCSCS